jgi:FAD/FMN-containing dehydrogenase
VVIDMSNFVQISVDLETFIAMIGTGNRLGDVAFGLNDAGRALPHGTCLYVGIGGHSGKAIIQYNLKIMMFYSLFILFPS